MSTDKAMVREIAQDLAGCLSGMYDYPASATEILTERMRSLEQERGALARLLSVGGWDRGGGAYMLVRHRLNRVNCDIIAVQAAMDQQEVINRMSRAEREAEHRREQAVLRGAVEAVQGPGYL